MLAPERQKEFSYIHVDDDQDRKMGLDPKGIPHKNWKRNEESPYILT